MQVEIYETIQMHIGDVIHAEQKGVGWLTAVLASERSHNLNLHVPRLHGWGADPNHSPIVISSPSPLILASVNRVTYNKHPVLQRSQAP